MNGKSLNLKRIVKVLLATLVLTALLGVCVAACGSDQGTYTPHENNEKAMDADFSYRSLNDEVKVLPNGDLHIREHIDMQFRKRTDENGKVKPWRRVFQRFTLSRADHMLNPLSDITDVSVKNVSTGQQYVQGTRGDVADPGWDANHARQWYAEDVGQGYGSRHAPYLPAAMNDSQYAQALSSTGGLDMNLKKSLDKDPISSPPDNTPTMGGPEDHIEIGWNIPAMVSASSLKFEVDMTFKDVVTLYDDVAYLKWEPISKENSTPIRKFTALITLPDGVDTQQTDTREWMHFKGDGSIRPKGRNALYAQAPTVGPENYVDVVSIFKASAMGQVRHRSKGEYKELIIQEEREEQVDAQGAQRGAVVGRVVLYLLFLIPELVAVVVGAVLVVKSHRQATSRDSGEYYRDIPDISPTAAAQLLCDLENPSGDSQLESRQLAATMLSLVRKKVIAIYPGQSQWYMDIDWAHVTDEQIGDRMRRGAAGEFDHSAVVIDKKEASQPFILRLHDEKGGLADTLKKKTGLGKRKKTSTIVLLPSVPEQKESSLTEIETSLLTLLQGMGEEFDSAVFDFQDIHDGLSGWLDGANKELDFHKKVHAEYDDMDLTDDAKAFGFAKMLLFLVGAAGYWYLYKLFIGDPYKASKFLGRQVFAFHGHIGIMLLMAMPVTFLLILEIFLIQTTVLTDSGRRLAGQVMGLSNYLRDFGDFKESKPEDLALWDQYLIYATAFGISGKLTRGMVKVWPQIADGDWLDSNGSGSLLYWSFYPSSHDIQGYSASDMSFGDVGGFGDLGDLGSQLSSGFSSAGGSIGGGDFGGGFGGGGSFGGSDGGSGGGSFGAM